MATHSSVLAWRLPGTREPGGLLSMGSHRVGHDWSDLAAAAATGRKFSVRCWEVTALEQGTWGRVLTLSSSQPCHYPVGNWESPITAASLLLLHLQMRSQWWCMNSVKCRVSHWRCEHKAKSYFLILRRLASPAQRHKVENFKLTSLVVKKGNSVIAREQERK